MSLIAQQTWPPMPQLDVIQCIPYQKCPICEGAGQVEEGDGLHLPTLIGCPTCLGARIIPMHCVKPEPLFTLVPPTDKVRIGRTNELCRDCNKVTAHDRYAHRVNNTYTEYTICEECAHKSNMIMGTGVKK